MKLMLSTHKINMHERFDITVLLSSYNGEQFIEQQIESILNQRGVHVRLVIRDDGSTDNTVKIIERLAGMNPMISFSSGQHSGVIPSFFELLEQATHSSHFYAISDQDDVWNADKLLNAVNELKKYSSERILMYCSAVEYVDKSLNHIKFSPIFSPDKVGFKNALVQNIATGCTMVLNNAALEKITLALPRTCVMHDWWIYLVVSAFGTVIYDPNSSIKYRQHHQNVMGIALTTGHKFKRRWSRLFSHPDSTTISVQLEEFYRIFGNELDETKRKSIHQLLFFKKNLFSRIAVIFSRDFQRQNLIDDILIRMVMLIGKF